MARNFKELQARMDNKWRVREELRPVALDEPRSSKRRKAVKDKHLRRPWESVEGNGNGPCTTKPPRVLLPLSPKRPHAKRIPDLQLSRLVMIRRWGGQPSVEIFGRVL